MVSDVISLDGHLIDSQTLSKVFDIIYQHGAAMDVQTCRIGHTKEEVSHVEIEVSAETPEKLEMVLSEVQKLGANLAEEPAKWQTADQDGVFPDDFYVTTNRETSVLINQQWVSAKPVEMDCGIRITFSEDKVSAETVPVNLVRKGDKIIVGHSGVKVVPIPRKEPVPEFAFMGSDVSSEKPKARMVKAVAEKMRFVKKQQGKTLIVGGPAIVHTGAAPYLEKLILAGWVDVLFAGNALATHDIERALYGTSLGIDLDLGKPATHGHQNHLKAINTIRKYGSIKKAVEQGILTTGIMHACIVKNISFVLAGSIRDDGPLPDVITDTMSAQSAMRKNLDGVGMAIMMATTLHSIATGNLLSADVATFCVDTDADTVIKLSDRGSHQAYGIVTDCEFFLKELCANLI